VTQPFWLSDLAIFVTVTHHFWILSTIFYIFVVRYNVSTIFAIVTQSFLYFVGHFLDFVAQYSDSVIFCYIDSIIFEILSNILEVFVSHFSDFTQSFLMFARSLLLSSFCNRILVAHRFICVLSCLLLKIYVLEFSTLLKNQNRSGRHGRLQFFVGLCAGPSWGAGVRGTLGASARGVSRAGVVSRLVAPSLVGPWLAGLGDE
jgi:hypothetical protein